MAKKAWGTTNVPKTGGNVDRMDWRTLTPATPWTIRMIGDILPNFIYWLDTKEGKRTRIVTNFNRETEQFDTTMDDPIGRLVAPKVKDMRPQFSYVTKVIDRADGIVKVFEISKLTVFNLIEDYAKKEDWGDPSAPDQGYDITIEKKKIGPLPQNVKYSITPSRKNTPLSDEEKALVEANTTDLEKLYKQETPEEQLVWLKEATDYLGFDAGLPGDGDDGIPF